MSGRVIVVLTRTLLCVLAKPLACGAAITPSLTAESDTIRVCDDDVIGADPFQSDPAFNSSIIASLTTTGLRTAANAGSRYLTAGTAYR